MAKLIVAVSGLHCRACEILTEERLEKLKNVKRVRAQQAKGRAEISYDGEAPETEAIRAALRELGYDLKEPGEQSAINPKKKIDTAWVSIVLTTAIIYLLGQNLNILNLHSLTDKEFSWSLALLVGLLAGFSTCLALVGGLVFGLAANYTKNHPETSRWRKFQPHLLFNGGRIVGFFAFGGTLGLLGSAFKPSPLFNGLLTASVGLVLLLLGLKLLNAPFFSGINFTWPKSWGRKIQVDSPLLLGALTFFLPCGFTQAMQVYALGSGTFWSGALVMSLFALGTTPGLLGLGGLSSLIQGRKASTLLKAAGAIVLLFAIFNLNNGVRLIKVSFPYSSETKNNSSNVGNQEQADSQEVQIIQMTETNKGYSPNRLSVKKGRPVRWVIDAQAPYSCASALIVPSLKIQKQLRAGENIIEFTPTKSGSIPFSCSMGMYIGVIEVSD